MHLKLSPLLVVALWGGMAAAQQDSPPAVTAEKPAAHPRHVITNDDLPPRPETEPETAKPKAAAASPADGKRDGTNSLAKVGLEKSSEADVKQAIEQIIKQEVALKEKLDRIKERMATEDDDFRRQMWNEALENQKNTLEQFRKVREKLEQQADPGKPQAPATPGS